MILKNQLKTIQKLLNESADEKALAANKKFVPGSPSLMYGTRMPALNDIAKQFKEGGFELVELLWKSGAWEEKILAAKMLGHLAKKDPEKTLNLIADFSKDVQDWVVCDTIGMQSGKALVKSHQKQIFELAYRLNKSTNYWQRRLSLVLVEWYTRDKSLHKEINLLVGRLENDNEYYVKKAIAWIKRNMQKGK